MGTPWVQGLRIRVYRIWGLGFRVEGLGFRDYGSGLMFLGFRD